MSLVPAIHIKLKKEDLIKNRILIIAVLMGLLCAWYGYNGIYKKAMEQMRKASGVISNEKLKTDAAIRLERLQAELNKYKGLFPEETDISWLMERVSSMAKDAGLEVVSLDSSPLEQRAEFKYGKVDISVSGSFNELGNFISRVEGSKEFMKIDSLSLKKEREQLNADISISTYFWKTR